MSACKTTPAVVAAINQGMRFSIIVKAPRKEPDTNESFYLDTLRRRSLGRRLLVGLSSSLVSCLELIFLLAHYIAAFIAPTRSFLARFFRSRTDYSRPCF